jgi:hypothetical protein
MQVNSFDHPDERCPLLTFFGCFLRDGAAGGVGGSGNDTPCSGLGTYAGPGAEGRKMLGGGEPVRGELLPRGETPPPRGEGAPF